MTAPTPSTLAEQIEALCDEAVQFKGNYTGIAVEHLAAALRLLAQRIPEPKTPPAGEGEGDALLLDDLDEVIDWAEKCCTTFAGSQSLDRRQIDVMKRSRASIIRARDNPRVMGEVRLARVAKAIAEAVADGDDIDIRESLINGFDWIDSAQADRMIEAAAQAAIRALFPSPEPKEAS